MKDHKGQFREIKKHRKAENDLRIKEEQLQLSLEAANAGMWIRDSSGNWRATPPLNTLFGRSEDDPPLLEEEFRDYIHPDDLPRLEKAWNSAKNGESVYDEEYRVIWPDGSIHWLASKGKIVLEDDMPRFIGITHDITPLKKGEKELRYQANLLNNVNNPIIATDLNRVITSWNKAAEKLYGYKAEEVVGKLVSDVIKSEFNDEQRKKAIKCLSTGHKYPLDVKQYTKEGKPVFIESNTLPIYSDNKVIGYVALNQDITERKKDEEQLKCARDDLELKVQERTEEIKQKNKILDGINAIFRATVTNQDEEEFGKTCLAVCEELTGSEFSFMGEINEKGRFDSIAVSERGWQACKMVKEQGPESVDDNVIRGIRSRAIEEKKILIFNDPVNSLYWSGLPEGHYIITSFLGAPLIYHDEVIGLIALANKKEEYSQEDIDIMEIITTAITESLMHSRALNQLNENQKQLKDAVEELKHSNQELEQFAYVSSHDLQEPLRTIASFTQLLEKRYKGKLDSDADEFIDYVVEAAIRMKTQIEGLLEYSRVGTKGKEFKPVDMNLILDQTINAINTLIKESNAKIIYNELPSVMGDHGQLQRVFQNLISNAIKFRKCEESPKIHISSHKAENANEYVFSIQDNGIGIEEQYFERIFTIFQRLHTIEEYHGTGIGLSIVKRIIERHGGRIWVESEFGVGSTFYFTVPMNE